jgi:hypothetical protein
LSAVGEVVFDVERRGRVPRDAYGDLIEYDQLDLTKSHQKCTPTLASDDAHWLKILKERVAVLTNAATT